MDEHSEGDLVAVFGGEFGKDSHVADTVTLCKVLVVGQKDLLVEHSTSYTSSYHIVPKVLCSKLYLDPKILSSTDTLKPQIGDLVVSYSRGLSPGDSERVTGILYKIMYRLGKPDKCELLCGTDMTTSNWEKLMVLHRPMKKSD